MVADCVAYALSYCARVRVCVRACVRWLGSVLPSVPTSVRTCDTPIPLPPSLPLPPRRSHQRSHQSRAPIPLSRRFRASPSDRLRALVAESCSLQAPARCLVRLRVGADNCGGASASAAVPLLPPPTPADFVAPPHTPPTHAAISTHTACRVARTSPAAAALRGGYRSGGWRPRWWHECLPSEIRWLLPLWCDGCTRPGRGALPTHSHTQRACCALPPPHAHTEKRFTRTHTCTPTLPSRCSHRDAPDVPPPACTAAQVFFHPASYTPPSPAIARR